MGGYKSMESTHRQMQLLKRRGGTWNIRPRLRKLGCQLNFGDYGAWERPPAESFSVPPLSKVPTKKKC